MATSESKSYITGTIRHPTEPLQIALVDENGSLQVTPMDAAGGPVFLAYLPAGASKSGSITAGGTAQVLSAALATRRGLVGQNISSGDLWINEIGGTAAVDTPDSYKVVAGAPFEVSTNRAISIVGATTGQEWSATEW